MHLRLSLFSAILATAAMTSAFAETREIRINKQFGLTYLAINVAVEKSLIEKHVRAAGLGEVKITFPQLASGASTNDALLSGNLDIASGSTPNLFLLSERTRGRQNFKGIMAVNESPIYLVTIDERIRTLKDYTEKDRIAVAGIGTSQHALLIQMASAQAFGWDNRNKLNSSTVAMAHPDAMAALLSGQHEVKSHSATLPFLFQELADRRVHTVYKSYDVVGGLQTLTVLWCSESWKNENPLTYKAVIAAMQESMDWIKQNRKEAAALYLKLEKSKLNEGEVYEMLSEQWNTFNAAPRRVGMLADFMHRIGVLKVKPASWKDYFFENMHALDGS